MSCLCIGGVCIPYSAILPLLLLGLQWMASQLSKVGLLPSWIAVKLGLSSTGKIPSTENCCNNHCSTSIPPTATNPQPLLHIDSLSQWQSLISSPSTPLIIKFTAPWCRPCQKIQPHFQSLSQQTNCKFVTVNVDGEGCEEVCSKFKIGMMPTFVCLRDGVEVGRMSGGREGRLTEWVGEMMTN